VPAALIAASHPGSALTQLNAQCFRRALTIEERQAGPAKAQALLYLISIWALTVARALAFRTFGRSTIDSAAIVWSLVCPDALPTDPR
jgi:hypothetical protein